MNSISKLKMGGMLILCFFVSYLSAQNYSAPSGAGNAGTNNTSVGADAGDVTTGSNLVAVGYSAGKSNTTGGANVFVGSSSGRSNTTGQRNTYIGNATGYMGTTGSSNVLIGYLSGYSITTGTGNVFVGEDVANSNNGSNNTFIGRLTGSSNTTGSNNVFIGYQAGSTETLSDRLYIDNSQTTTPLIYGDFALNQLGINSRPNSTHTLTIGGTLYATGIYVNGQSISSAESWTTAGTNVYSNGGKNVGIGTTLANNPKGYKFAVNGKMGAKEIEIENTSLTWSDFVFADDYELMSLEELDQFIKQHNHLPNIQTQEEVRQNGYSVSEMDAKLLQKVEELTLYVIELKKEIEELKSKK